MFQEQAPYLHCSGITHSASELRKAYPVLPWQRVFGSQGALGNEDGLSPNFTNNRPNDKLSNLTFRNLQQRCWPERHLPPHPLDNRWS
jgi:hypothetical protein